MSEIRVQFAGFRVVERQAAECRIGISWRFFVQPKGLPFVDYVCPNRN